MSCSDLVSYNSNPDSASVVSWLLKEPNDGKCQNCGLNGQESAQAIASVSSANHNNGSSILPRQSQAKPPFMCCWVKASMLLVEGRHPTSLSLFISFL